MTLTRQQIIKKTKRLVIKIGSGVLTNEQGIRPSFLRAFAREIQNLAQQKIEAVIVSSGAIASGMHLLGIARRPEKIGQKQAVAALGQPLLMHDYTRAFAKVGLKVAQILLSRDDLLDSRHFLTAKHAFTELFRYGVIPIINENDSVAVEEIKVGDNDQLSAYVAHLVDADLLLILSDIDGFHDRDPKKHRAAKRISIVDAMNDHVLSFASDTLSEKSTGGMVTKLKAVQYAAQYGIFTWLVNGLHPKILHRVMHAEDVGTLFVPKK